MPINNSITQVTLQNIKPTGKVQFIRDESLSGFGIKVTAKGKASYFAEKRVRGGRTVRKQIGDVSLLSLKEAKQEAQELLLRLAKGEDVVKTAVIEAAPHNSLAKSLDRYITIRTAKKLKASTAAKYRQQVTRLFDDWLTMPVHAISASMVEDKYTRLLKRGKSVNYINSAFRTLKAVINSTGVATNPVTKASRMWALSLSSEPKNTFLRSGDIKQLLGDYSRLVWASDPTRPDLHAFLVFVLLTGCRKSEALSLKWANVTDREITFKNTKNHSDHTIPNVGLISDVINHRRYPNLQDSERVFLMTDNMLKTRLKKARERGDIGSFIVHDLRRTFAEHSQLAGFYPHQISLALNHSANDVTRKNYLAGKLAKLSNLRSMYSVYQNQLISYINGGNDEAGVAKDYNGGGIDGMLQQSLISSLPQYYKTLHGELVEEILES